MSLTGDSTYEITGIIGQERKCKEFISMLTHTNNIDNVFAGRYLDSVSRFLTFFVVVPQKLNNDN
jgi:hypothetical protein